MKIADLLEKKDPATTPKIKRDAFLYMEPKSPKEKFAQCETCQLFLPNKEKCGILGDTHVTASMSCGVYVHGEPDNDQPITSYLTKEEVGLVDRKVRCENCISFKNNKCALYELLNKTNPDIFDLDVKVNKYGCCNAQTPK